MFRNPTTDLILVLVVVLVIFGPKRLPTIGRELGRGMREFKDSITGHSKDDEEAERPAIAQASAQSEGATGANVVSGGRGAESPAARQPESVSGGTESRP